MEYNYVEFMQSLAPPICLLLLSIIVCFSPSHLYPQDIPDAKEAGLSHLCEFIEDCEFTFLSTQILHLLGKSGTGCTGENCSEVADVPSVDVASAMCLRERFCWAFQVCRHWSSVCEYPL